MALERRLLADGTSFRLLEDGTSKRLLETSTVPPVDLAAQISIVLSVASLLTVEKPLATVIPVTSLLSGFLPSANPTYKVNGLVKDYTPVDGIDFVDSITFDPTSQDWAAGKFFACPQGFQSANAFPTRALVNGMPADTGIPLTGTNKGTWVSGTSYVRYDKVIDSFDGLQYVLNVASSSGTVAPHSTSIWSLATQNSFAPRSIDASFYGSVRANGDATRWFSTEENGRGLSGTTEPTGSSGTVVDNKVEWSIQTTAIYTSWPANTVVNVGDFLRVDGSWFRVQSAGTTDPTSPTFTGVGTYGSGLISDGPDVQWRRTYVDAGTWAASSYYGFRVVNGVGLLQGGNDVRKQAVLRSDGKMMIVSAVMPTDGKTGSTEPAWSAAGAGTSFWEDFTSDGTIIWRKGTFAIVDPTVQAERFVVSGFASATIGTQFTVINGAAAGTPYKDVVLADKDALNRAGTGNLDGTDKESAYPFSLGGLSKLLGPGESVDVVFDGTYWQIATAGVSLASILNITSGIAPALSVSKPLASQIDIFSTLVGAASVSKPLGSTLALSLGFSPALTDGKPLASTLALSLALSPAMAVGKPLASTLALALGISPALVDGKPLASQIDVLSTLAGAISVSKPLASTLPLALAFSPTLTVTGSMTATVAASLAFSPSLGVQKPLASVVAAALGFAPAMAVGKPLASLMPMASLVTPDLRDAKTLASQIDIVSVLTSDLRDQKALASLIAMVAQVGGDLRDQKQLASQINVLLAMSGTMNATNVYLASQIDIVSLLAPNLRDAKQLAAALPILLALQASLQTTVVAGLPGRRMMFGVGR